MLYATGYTNYYQNDSEDAADNNHSDSSCAQSLCSIWALCCAFRDACDCNVVILERNRVPLHFEVGQLCGFEFVVQVASRVLVDARNLAADDGGPAFDAADENVLVTDAKSPHEESD